MSLSESSFPRMAGVVVVGGWAGGDSNKCVSTIWQPQSTIALIRFVPPHALKAGLFFLLSLFGFHECSVFAQPFSQPITLWWLMVRWLHSRHLQPTQIQAPKPRPQYNERHHNRHVCCYRALERGHNT